MQVNHVKLRGQISLRKLPRRAEAGVVDQQVQAFKLGDASFNPFDVGRVGQVGGQNPGADRVLTLQFSRQGRQPFLAPGHQDQVVSYRRQPAGKGGADAARGAGD